MKFSIRIQRTQIEVVWCINKVPMHSFFLRNSTLKEILYRMKDKIRNDYDFKDFVILVENWEIQHKISTSSIAVVPLDDYIKQFGNTWV